MWGPAAKAIVSPSFIKLLPKPYSGSDTMFSVRDQVVKIRPVSARGTLSSNREHQITASGWAGGAPHHVLQEVPGTAGSSWIRGFIMAAFWQMTVRILRKGCPLEFTQGYLLSSLRPGWQPGVLTTMVD